MTRGRVGFLGLSVAMMALVGANAACRRAGKGWSADEMTQFRSLCAGGNPEPICDCLASELPGAMSFASYRGIVAASHFEPGADLDDEALKKLAHATTTCAAKGVR
jgi:hypothetical protein